MGFLPSVYLNFMTDSENNKDAAYDRSTIGELFGRCC